MPVKTTTKTLRKKKKKQNPLRDGTEALAYLMERRGGQQFARLARNAGLGLSFAAVLTRFFTIEKWLTSSRNQKWVREAGGAWMSYPAEYFAIQEDQAEGAKLEMGSLASGIFEIVRGAGSMHRQASQVYSLFDSNDRSRDVAVACKNDLAMMTVFATRCARQSGIPTPTVLELAALSVFHRAESGTSSLEERDRRLDKFRKIMLKMPRTESLLSHFLSLNVPDLKFRVPGGVGPEIEPT